MMDESKTPEDVSLNQHDSIPLQPMPQTESISGGHLTHYLVLIAGAGFVTYVLLGGTQQACRGATRSSKLRWQQRQEEMARAEREGHFDFQSTTDATSNQE